MKENILLVEDEEALQMALSDRLRREGYVVDSAADGEVGFEKATTLPFDLIVLDIMLPGRNGALSLRAYHHTYGLPAVTTNCSNNYGPFQFPEKLIALMIANALEGKPLPVYGDGRQVRDWLYVGDHCAAIRRALAAGRPGEVYNIGGNAERRNIDVVHAICDALQEVRPRGGGYRELVTPVADRPGHDRRYALSSEKLTKETGWSPQMDFEMGLSATVDWYRSNPNWVQHVKSGEYQTYHAKNYENRSHELSGIA